MDSSIAIIGILMMAALVVSIFIKSYLDKKRIANAREMVELQDDLRRMQAAMSIIPDLYFDVPTKIFMFKRVIQLASKLQEFTGEDAKLNILMGTMQEQLQKIQGSKDNRAARLTQWSKINNPDTAHEARSMIKFLHGQMVIAVKSSLIPKALGTRVVANLKIMTPRLAMDLNYNLAQGALKLKKYRPALGKLRVTKTLLLKSNIKQHMKKQLTELDELIKSTETHLNAKRKKAQAQNVNKLADGVEDMNEKDQWDQKKNLYE